MDTLQSLFYSFVQAGILLLEFTGATILIVTAVKCIFHLIKGDDNVRLMLAQGIALALEFKLGGEVLRTVLVHDINELVILGATVILRGAITFLIHWEIKTEESKMCGDTEQESLFGASEQADSQSE